MHMNLQVSLTLIHVSVRGLLSISSSNNMPHKTLRSLGHQPHQQQSSDMSPLFLKGGAPWASPNT